MKTIFPEAPEISRGLALKISQNSPLVFSGPGSIENVTFKISDIIEVVFGLRVRNLHEDLIPIILKAIHDDFPEITMNDIDLAFSIAEIEKKQGTSLTRDEFLKPIRAYWNKKMILVESIRKTQEAERIEAENKLQHFRDSIKAYQDGIKTGKYSGTFAQANTIARDYLANKLTLPEKLLIKAFAERLERMAISRRWKLTENNRKNGNMPIPEIVPVPKFEMFYALAMCRIACKMKITIVID